MRNPTHVRLFSKRRIALLLFVTMLIQVLLVFPSSAKTTAVVPVVEVPSEESLEATTAVASDGMLSSGIYTIDNVYLKDNYGTYGSFYLRNESGSVILSTNTYGNVSDDMHRYWYFESMGNDQYRIHSMADYSKTLSVSGGDAVLTSVASASLWKLQKVGSQYQLLCVPNTSNDLLAVTSTPATHQHPSNLSYYYCTADVYVGAVAGMTFDRWNITPVNLYSYTVNHYYDQGFYTRFYSAYGDIISYQVICSKILDRLFGVDVTSAVVQGYTSCADTCTGLPVTLDKTKELCSCGNIDHKERYSIMSNLSSQFGNGTSTMTRVAWTGHKMFKDDDRSASYNTSGIVVMGLIGVVNPAYDNGPIDMIRDNLIHVLLHELSHQLGASDHYCYGDFGEDGTCSNRKNDCYFCDRGLLEPPVCLMSEDWMTDLEDRLNNGTIDTIYCSQCMSATHNYGILTHLENHHS